MYDNADYLNISYPTNMTPEEQLEFVTDTAKVLLLITNIHHIQALKLALQSQSTASAALAVLGTDVLLRRERIKNLLLCSSTNVNLFKSDEMDAPRAGLSFSFLCF